MILVNSEEILARQQELEDGKHLGQEDDLEALLNLLWIIRSMDVHGDYSIEHYYQRLERYLGVRIRTAQITDAGVAELLERWAGEIRKFLKDHMEIIPDKGEEVKE